MNYKKALKILYKPINTQTYFQALLPCKVGSEAFYLYQNPATFEWNMHESFVYAIMILADGVHIFTEPKHSFPENEIGKTLFFARKEAEKALEEKKWYMMLKKVTDLN